MKKILCVLFALSMFFGTACRAEEDVAALTGSNNVFAGDDEMSFLTLEEIPTGASFLPMPPKPGENAFYNDWSRYEWGKTMRDTERGKQAAKDAVHTLEYFSEIFSDLLGVKISKENTPEIYTLLDRLLATTRMCNQKSKARLMRVRPFVQFHESTPVPEDEERLSTNSSYPSGHTTMGWAIALVLSEINPTNQDAIIKRGFEYGESRVIVGFHYQSDVDAARVITSVLLNRLHANKDFMMQLQKAKEEFSFKKASEN